MPEAESKKARILIVEDDTMIAELLDTALVGEGFEVCVAKDRLDAFAQIVGFEPDVVVSDLSIPASPLTFPSPRYGMEVCDFAIERKFPLVVFSSSDEREQYMNDARCIVVEKDIVDAVEAVKQLLALEVSA